MPHAAHSSSTSSSGGLHAGRAGGRCCWSTSWSSRQLTMITVTLYLHRSQTHRGVDFHPMLSALLPLLELADHLDGDQGVGGDPSQAPRQVRDRGRSAQPALQGHQHRAVAAASSCTAKRAQDTRDASSSTARARPDDWIERHVYTPAATNLGIDAAAGRRASRCSACRAWRCGRCR